MPPELYPLAQLRSRVLTYKSSLACHGLDRGIFLYLMGFEFDPEKSAANKTQRGIDFAEAQEIWNDTGRLEIPARSLDEPRFQVIGRIGERTWSAFITYRDEKIPIISVRRARPDEEARYLAD